VVEGPCCGQGLASTRACGDAVAETEEWTEIENVEYKKWGKVEYMTKDGEKERIMLTTHEVPTEQFVTYACEQLVSYADHVTTLRRQSFAAQQAIHNMEPHVVLLDIDFAENMEFRVRNASQSSYWKGLGSATLFICVVRLLCLDAWGNRSGFLSEGDAVTLEEQGSDGVACFHSGQVVRDYTGVGEMKVQLHYDLYKGVDPGFPAPPSVQDHTDYRSVR
jgi:hypothetical protein